MTDEEWAAMIQQNADALVAQGFVRHQAKIDAHWESHVDVSWEDLNFFLDKCRRDKDEESFNTAMRVLEALRKQILERKSK